MKRSKVRVIDRALLYSTWLMMECERWCKYRKSKIHLNSDIMFVENKACLCPLQSEFELVKKAAKPDECSNFLLAMELAPVWQQI